MQFYEFNLNRCSVVLSYGLTTLHIVRLPNESALQVLSRWRRGVSHGDMSLGILAVAVLALSQPERLGGGVSVGFHGVTNRVDEHGAVQRRARPPPRDAQTSGTVTFITDTRRTRCAVRLTEQMR